ncbi:porin [Sphingobium boeckii]|uniref:Alginate export domain-containing protein n=1 Tax=Sphingobium boeckii TaxID=1082345 RepID=A0A7W9AGT2_9SPHN|nr:porin [Sphingobium boeckii]MBB5685379.1 hypothetical protein [Sphingobium boeckii]
MSRPLALFMAAGCFAAPAAAQTGPDFKPIMDARLRYETVDQAGFARNADAVTARMRAGFELKQGDFAFLAEAEALLAIENHYNSTVNGPTGFPVVADPQTIGLNRLQAQYRGLPKTVVTLGRQRINLDDQRFVGSVNWRQDEQTFDAVRVETMVPGGLAIDATYAWSDRTIYGIDSPFQSIGGDNVFASVAKMIGPVTFKGFAYLVDQDEPGRRQFSSQTYGLRAVGGFKLGSAAKLNLIASYARQSDWQDNPNAYRADYWLGEAAIAAHGFTLTGGYEVLGAGFQTPLATLHKFQGWADKFLVTPANGIRDLYASAGYALPVKPIGPVSMLVAYHQFDSDRLGVDYGSEWDAQIGFKPSKRTSLLLKYADYNARSFATDTSKLWLQLDYIL